MACGASERRRSAHKLVQLYVSHLRKLLVGCDARDRHPWSRIRAPAGRRSGRRGPLRAAGECGGASPRAANGEAREALALWGGGVLADLADEPFAAAEIRRLEELHLQAAELAIEADLAAGRHGEVVGELEALVVEEPLREQLHAQRMLALYRSGRQSEALQAYREVRELLVDQIGVEPGPELRRLHAAILRQDSELEPPAAELSRLPPELDARSPLVGREGELERLRDHWRKAHGGAGRVVLVVGRRRDRQDAPGGRAGGRGACTWSRSGLRGRRGARFAAALGRARRATAPALVAFDDLDRAPAEIVSGAAGLAAGARRTIAARGTGVQGGPAPAAVGRLARELEGQGAELLALGPLAATACVRSPSCTPGAAAPPPLSSGC